MKTIYFEDIKEQIKSLSITIGGFDGLHLAHQALINECLKSANELNCQSALITFEPLIATTLEQKPQFPLLSFATKAEMIKKMGIDYLIIIKFDKAFSQKSASSFIQELKKKLDIKHLTVGFDFSFGQNGTGKVELLKEYFDVTIIPEMKYDGIKIGTKQIKEYLKQGLIDKANQLLGYSFFLEFDQTLNSAYHLLKNQAYRASINGQAVMFNPYNHHLDTKTKCKITFS